MRFPANPPDLFANRQREALLLDCAALLSDEPGSYEAQRADLLRVMVQMLAPPALWPEAEHNALRLLEHSFQNQVAELENHCGVQQAAALSAHDFFCRVEYFEGLVRARGGAAGRNEAQ